MDDQELEARLRAGLSAHAEDADVAAPVADRARADVGRRRRTRWSVGAAAASVVLVAGGVAVATGGDGPAPEPPVAGTTAADPTDVPPEGEWRTEYWAGLAVDVPAGWGYGGAPMPSRPTPVACYPAAMVGPDGKRPRGGEDPDLGWVGRPITLTDVCAGYPWIEHSPQEEPSAPYVWLGAAVEPGTVEYGNGYVQETVEVEGTTLTVASDDAALREAVLASARPGDLCAARLARAPEPSYDEDGDQGGTGLTVCAYRRSAAIGDPGPGLVLSYAAHVDTATPYDDVADAAARVFYRCAVSRDTEIVVLTTDRGSYTVDFTCPGILHPDGSRRAFVVPTVQPWVVGGIPAVVTGPTGGKGAMIDSFIGMQG